MLGPSHFLRLNRLNGHFFILITVASVYGIGSTFVVQEFVAVWPAFFVSVIIALLGMAVTLNRNPTWHFWQMITLALAFGGSIPAFFLATAPLVRASNTHPVDATLVFLDSSLLGWAFPSGQISLWLDRSEYLNPSTFYGRLYTEILQLAYMCYYVVGATTLCLLLVQYWRAYKNGTDLAAALGRNKLKMYLCAWMSAYYVTFFLNVSFPGKSPRLYLADQYAHQLDGFGLAASLRNVSTDDTSYGTFPSGHISESLIAAIFAYYLNKPLGVALIVVAVLIALSTQILRYHYWMDALGAIVVTLAALFFGFALSSTRFSQQLQVTKDDFLEIYSSKSAEDTRSHDEKSLDEEIL